jgi:hypothetical protein
MGGIFSLLLPNIFCLSASSLLLESLLFANVIELLLESERVLFPLALMIAGGNHPDV